MLRSLTSALAFLAAFWFPWPLTAVLAFGASLLLPPVALAVGILVDLLYAWRMPWGTILGAFGSLLAYLVRRFVKARIM